MMKNDQSIEAVRGGDLFVQGRRTHLLEHGPHAAPAVLLLHGCGSLAQEVIAPFSDIPLRVVAPDRPGYGFSDPLPQDERGPMAQSIWLEHLIEELAPEGVSLAGHSIGCAQVILLAERRPDLVKALFLIAPFCRPTPEQSMLLLRLAIAPAIGPWVTKHVIHRFADYFGTRAMRAAHHPNPVPANLLNFPYRHAANHTTLRVMADELWGFNVDMAEEAGAPISCPTYILYGKADSVADPDWHLPWLLNRIPRAKVRLFDGIGHNPHHAAPAVACAILQEAVGNRDAIGAKARRSSRYAG